MNAARCGHTKLAYYLIKKGANIQMRDDNNWTAVHWAARGNNKDLFYLLLAFQADASNSGIGRPALLVGLRRDGQHKDILEFFTKPDVEESVRNCFSVIIVKQLKEKEEKRKREESIFMFRNIQNERLWQFFQAHYSLNFEIKLLLVLKRR